MGLLSPKGLKDAAVQGAGWGWAGSIPGRGNGQCKGPAGGTGVACAEDRESTGPGAEGAEK